MAGIPEHLPHQLSRRKPQLAGRSHNASNASIPYQGGVAPNAGIGHLRQTLQQLERQHSLDRKAWILPTGYSEIDTALPENGLPSHSVHAIAGSVSICFLLKLLAQLPNQPETSTLLWCRSAKASEVPYGPVFHQNQIDTEGVIFVQCKTDKDLLWTMEEALRSNALDLVIGEPEKAIDLTASRRLQLAAETGGSMGILLSLGDLVPCPPNGLFSRWHISPAEDENLHIDLQRIRSGKPQSWICEYDYR
ncbi:MAG: hypothetical protein R3261_04190 [Alphaproteobacteria bacterium]|nr:hypothetical protein [Alphaproteobacteria bacterium]